MAEPSRVLYACEPALAVREFRRVLMEAGLGASRPVEDLPRFGAMLAAADLILTARLHQAQSGSRCRTTGYDGPCSA